MKRLSIITFVLVVLCACSSENDEPEPVPVVPTTPEQPADTAKTDTVKTPETPQVKTYPAKYCVAQMTITTDGGADNHKAAPYGEGADEKGGFEKLPEKMGRGFSHLGKFFFGHEIPPYE